MSSYSSRLFPPLEGYYGLFNDSFPPILDGVTLAVENYAQWLQQAHREPCVVTPSNPTPYSTPYRVLRYFSLPIYNRTPYRYGYPRADFKIWQKLRDTPFRIAHAHCPFSSGRLALYAARKHRIPLIATFHSKYRTDLEHSFRKCPWFVDIIMKKILDFFDQCDEVWIPQSHVAETVREYGYKGELKVMENGNDFAHLAGDDVFSYKLQARQRLGWDDDTLSLIFVGQHILEKGIITIVDALEHLKGRMKFRMSFIGSGYAQDILKKQIEKAGLSNEITLLGTIQDRSRLSDYYAASDLFLFPSYYDNAPLVVREAAAFATPAILLAGSTASEVITHRENGFTCNHSPREYADTILFAHNNREILREVALGAKETIVRSWEDVVREVIEHYDEAIERYNSNNKYSVR